MRLESTTVHGLSESEELSQMIPTSVRNAFQISIEGDRCQPLPGGLSGARVYRCRDDQQSSFALKRWAMGSTARRVAEVHSVMKTAASACDLLPGYKTTSGGETFVVDHDDAIWEMVDWINGEPLSMDASIQQVQAGAVAIADIHRTLKCQGEWWQPSPAIAERLSILENSRTWLPKALDCDLVGRVHPAVLEPVADACHLLRSRWGNAAAKFRDELSVRRQHKIPCQWVIRDIHRENALFGRSDQSGELLIPPKTVEKPEIEAISGVIDFDAIRVETPAVDLARWVSSFSIYDQDAAAAIDSVLAAYLPRAPLSQGTNATSLRKLVGLIAETSSWMSVLNWVRWLVVESRQFPDFQRVAGRLRRLVDSRVVSSL